MLLVPVQWVTFLPLSESQLRSYNQFLCHIAYAPIAVVLTLVFTGINLVYAPIAYVRHLLSLINTLTDADETMDEFDEKLARFYTIVIYTFTGLFIHLASVPVDSFVYFYNLYTKPAEADEVEDTDLISHTALE